MTADWRDLAACGNDLDPDRWFPGPEAPKRQIATLLAVCARCPVRIQCLQDALDRDERYGIWGGVTAEGRRTLARQRTTGTSGCEGAA